MIRGRLADILVNDRLPKDYRLQGNFTTKDLKKTMIGLAKASPEVYKIVVPKIKKLGDEFSTFEGISVGLDDIEPEYSKRDPILNNAKRALRAAGSNHKKKMSILLDTQSKLRDLTSKHPGDMGMMARSGSRGNMNQLMKMVSSPGIVGDYDGAPIPFLIERGYSEGLSPAEAWIAGDESRSQVIKGQLGTAEPGEMQKVLASVMSEQVIASNDCGTRNGITLEAADPSIEGRHDLTGSLIDARRAASFARTGKNVRVRSPMTCELESGVCQKCMGSSNKGNSFSIGLNVGIRSAQSLSEPLTQMALSSKHGVSLVEGDHNKPKGLAAFKQFVEIPKNFFQRAPISQISGKIMSIAKAPQGGFDVDVSGTAHYVPPGRSLKIKQGQNVEAGDVLGSGIVAPDDVVKHKGLGAGREYLVKSLRDVYTESGKNLDPRHFELLAKSQLNYVKVNGDVPGFVPGDVVSVSSIRKAFEGKGSEIATKEGVGKVLTAHHGAHLPGTRLTTRVVEDLQRQGINRVNATSSNMQIEPIMAAATRTPLLNPNWMQRLGYRYQKATIINAATFGEKADLHSHNPIPALAVGHELRRDSKGRY
jgi:DNA-directed RNA polymerase subunit beta'